MYIVLPQSPGQLDFVLQKITTKLLVDKMSLMQNLPVDVMLPKFKFDFTSHLESNLREVKINFFLSMRIRQLKTTLYFQLGIRDIFEPSATLTGIPRTKSTSRQLVVSDVIQKIGIDINEKGTTAYVATGAYTIWSRIFSYEYTSNPVTFACQYFDGKTSDREV